ncbi:proliferating cell nuclear antigen [Clavulina sp. PMI_390]|nr:proliferating cell nuclear antigen [Clavulina sp. PMI_390]
MFESKLSQAAVLKKLLDGTNQPSSWRYGDDAKLIELHPPSLTRHDLVTDANFECNEEGLIMQAMDNSHVALVAIKLEKDGFQTYRCDHAMPLGVNLTSLTKVLKCSKDDDVVTLKAEDNADVLSLKFESKNSDRVAEYDMKLMDIDQDVLAIPETEYDCKVYMPSNEFTRICRELATLGESVRIEVSKEGIRFASEGDIANGSVLIKPSSDASKYSKKSNGVKKEPVVKKEKNDDDEEMEEDDGGAAEDDEDAPAPKKKKAIFVEDEEEDEDAAEPEEEPEEEDSSSKKRKRKTADEGKSAKKVKKGKNEDEDEGNSVAISVTQAVSLSFSLKYLINFSKAGALCTHVELMLSAEVPLLCLFSFEQGSIKYYLAPKIGDE